MNLVYQIKEKGAVGRPFFKRMNGIFVYDA